MTKNLSSLLLGALLLSFSGIACKNPIASYTKQYSCTIAGLPEPENSKEYLDRGYKHYQDNDYKNDPGDCALGACAEAIRLDPQNADAYYCRAMMLRDKGERDKALADIDEAIKLKGDKAQFYNLRGVLYGDKNMYEKGLADLNRQIELMGSDATHYDYARRGDFYYELDKPEEAIKDYTKAIELKPDYQYHYSDRASAYEKLGKKDLAEADKLKASELEPAGKVEQPPPVPTTGDTGSNSNKSPNTYGNTVSGGVMNDKATNLPEPAYPPAARAASATGAVNVQIAVDENGNVTAATAVSGHPLLRAAAVAAARGAKFKPTLINGKPYRVTGVLVFNFTP
jgi:TonB family protein